MKLLFKNPVFKPGKNVTVRRGIKWALPMEVTPRGIPVCDTYAPNIILGYATNVVAKMKRFCDIKVSEIADEHDEKCQTIAGLHEAMIRAYGEGFDFKEIVTILEFDYCPEPQK